MSRPIAGNNTDGVSQWSILPMTDDKSKLCCACKQEKPLSEFYMRGKYPTSECKICMKARNSKKSDKPLIMNVPSELRVLDILNDNGIPSLPGKAIHHPYADVVSWGCLLIEVKTSKLQNGRFTWDFSKEQITQGMRADMVILECQWDNGEYSYHFFNADDGKFYKEGRVKAGITYTPNRSGSGMHSVFTEQIMAETQLRWDMLETKRLEIEADLRKGKTWLMHDRLKIN